MRLYYTIAALLTISSGLCAQDLPSGSITTGYRFTDVQGYRPQYTQYFGLNSGFRVMDFSLFSKPIQPDKPNRFYDSYALTVSGLGGDPYTTAQLTLRKNHVYELRANFRQTHYYWDQSNAALPTAGVAGLITQGLTTNHAWATVRKVGSLNLLIHATENLRFSFDYDQNTRDGVTLTTQTLDYFGSSSTWGSFARANPYILIAPVSESSHRATAGVDYTPRGWALHYKVGYQHFEDSINGNNLSNLERSINTDPATASATAKELLLGANFADYRKMTTPVSEFSYTGKLLPQLEARGSYLFYRYSGPASLALSADGTARTNTGGTTFAPYAIALTTQSKVDQGNQVLEQGFTYKVKEWWSAFADYRYARFTTDSSANFNSLNAAVVSTGTSLNQWRIGTSTLDLETIFTPFSSLLLRAGVRLMKNDVELLTNSISDPTNTKRIRSAWPIGSFHYQPSQKLTIRGDADQTTTGTSYTRITPHVDVGGRFSVRYRPFAGSNGDKFYLEDTGVFRNQTLLSSDFHSSGRSNATTINYDWNDKVTVFAGFSYDSYYAASTVSFLRGTAPFTNLALTDQTVSRVWQSGVRANPTPRLGITFTGNFVRATGFGQISGEPALYGPMKFPYATGSIYYDVPRVGRWTLQLQRTYYIEQVVTSNNFGAKLLTILYTRNF